MSYYSKVLNGLRQEGAELNKKYRILENKRSEYPYYSQEYQFYTDKIKELEQKAVKLKDKCWQVEKAMYN